MKILIRTKLIFSVITVILIFGSLATFSVFQLLKNELVKRGKENLRQLTVESTHEIIRFFSASRDLVGTIASQKKIIEYFENPEIQSPEILDLLKQYNIGNNYVAIYLIDFSGNTLASTDESFINKNYSFRNYFKEAIQGGTGTDVAIGVTSHQPGYYFSAPIKKDGKIIGVVALKKNPEFLNKIISDNNASLGKHVMFSDSYGVIIYSDLEERIYKSLGKLSKEQLNAIKSENKFSDLEITPLQYELVQNVIDNYQSPQVAQFFDKADGEEEILAVSRVNDSPFFLIYETEAEEIIAPAYAISSALSLFVFFAALAAAVIISLLVNRFLKPLAEFKSSVSEISAGNFDKKVSAVSNDELGDLSQDFNKMIDKVKSSRENIEKKVLIRTAELNKFNQLMIGRELKMIELKKQVKDLEKGIGRTRQVKTWSDKFKEAVEVEEGVINQLKSVYLIEIEKAKLSTTKKKKMKKLLNKLVKDSLRHDQEFKKLIIKANDGK